MSNNGISAPVERMLLARSGGYCQNPSCNNDLFVEFGSGKISTIRELAHVIAQSPDGPRGASNLLVPDRDAFENIIVLCPVCHTVADKNPEEYPPELLLQWKRQHEAVIRSRFMVPVYDDRECLRDEVYSLLRTNRYYHSIYGPESEAALNPLSDAFKLWKHHVLNDIIPNNRRIAGLLVRNQHLLTDQEKNVLQEFLAHKEGFEYNHLSGEKNASMPLFPRGMSNLLE
jgi:hypothetical protein